MRSKTSTTRVLQIGMVILLAVCLAQVIWWTLDEAHHTSDIRERFLAHWQDDRRAADRLLEAGTASAIVEQIYPHLEVRAGRSRIREESRIELGRERYHRLRRYGWEGAFFIAVLMVSMTIVSRALREETRLRRRQQNFLSTVSHEFKSPLASLQLSAETMALRELPAERRQVLVGRMLDDIGRMENMASKILNTSRLEQSRVELRLEALDLVEAIQRALKRVEDRAHEAEVDIHLETPATLPAVGDLMATRTVIQNLLENAVQATALAGGGRVTLRGKRRDQQVVLEVRDTGVGFRPAEARQLFQKFYRAGDELTRKSAGTGLGLFIVKRLMHHQKGSVTAHSDGPGKGAVFTTTWPTAPEN